MKSEYFLRKLNIGLSIKGRGGHRLAEKKYFRQEEDSPQAQSAYSILKYCEMLSIVFPSHEEK